MFGVSGSGKTTISRMLSKSLNCQFIEGDDFHPTENILKMSSGHPLTDADRLPWIKDILAQAKKIDDEYCVISCSSLKKSYRDVFRERLNNLMCFGFELDRRLIFDRLSMREGHFMPVDMLDSQIATYEKPIKEPSTYILNPKNPPELLVNEIIDILKYEK